MVDMISISVQLITFHTFCLRCFIENDIACKICSLKNIDISRSTESEKSLETGKYSLLKAVLAKKITLMRQIFCRVINYAAPRNEHVGIIFRVNCFEASFSQLDYFIFKFTSRVSENCFLNLTKKQGKKVRVQKITS